MSCASAAPGPTNLIGSGAPPMDDGGAPEPDGAHELTAIKAQLMKAAYAADFDELAKGRTRALALEGDEYVGYIAHYWAGYASWHAALNGTHADMAPETIEDNLRRALKEFQVSTQLRSDFADGYAAQASIHGWLTRFAHGDAAEVTLQMNAAKEALEHAVTLAPRSPRVLWVQASDMLFKPRKLGGDPFKAVQVYRAIADGPDTRSSDSPLPDWGKAEALMGLAYAHVNQPPLEVANAREEALQALRIQPNWSYVRDVLLPLIEAKGGVALPDGGAPDGG